MDKKQKMAPREIEWVKVDDDYYYEKDREYGFEIRRQIWGHKKDTWGLYTARWDKPDWYADSLEEAKKLAEDGPPTFFGPNGEPTIEIPFD